MFFQLLGQPTGQLGTAIPSFGAYIPPPPRLTLAQQGIDRTTNFDPNAGFGTYPTTSNLPRSGSSNPNVIVYPNSTGSGNNIFQTVSALISQGVSAFGRNPSIQVGTSPTVQTPLSTTIQSGALLAQSLNPPQQNYPPAYNPNNPSASLGGGLGSGLDGIINWITQNPLIVLGAGLGAYLLFKPPPGRR